MKWELWLIASDKLARELAAVSEQLAARTIHVRRGSVVSAPPAEKTFSLVPVDATINTPFQPKQRPSEMMMLRAYQESPWLHIKIARLAASFASIPFEVLAERREGKPVIMPRTYPLVQLLRHPNPMLRGWDFRFLTELYTRVVGSCWWRIIPNGFGRPAQLWVYPNHWVKPILYSKTEEVTVELRTPMTAWHVERIPLSEMVWLRVPDPIEPYARGLGDAQSLATEVDTFDLAAESDRRFFQNDASPPGALVVPGKMNQDETDRMRDEWNRKYGGTANYGTMPILFGGMDYKTFRTGRKEMDFIDGQRYLRDTIIAGVHKHVLGITDDVNFAAAKAADYQVSKWELAPRVPWWEDYTDHIAGLFDDSIIVRWKNPVPADEQIEIQRTNNGWLRGAITRNEWRERNGFELVEGPRGDVFLLQSGTVEVSADGQTVLDSENELEEEADPNNPHDPSEENPERSARPRMKARASRKTRPAPMHPRIDRVLDAIVAGIDTAKTQAALQPLYEAVATSRLADIKDEVGEIGEEITFDMNDPLMIAYMRNQAGERIRGIDETTRDRIRKTLAIGLEKNEDIGRLTKRLTDVFDSSKGARATLIAKTEVLDASNAVAYAAYSRSEVVEAIEWILDPDYDPTKDDGYCQDIADSGPIPKGGTFLDGIAWAPAHPACVCTIGPVVSGDEGKSVSRWTGEERKAHARSLKAEHLRLARNFEGRMKRIFQTQQRDCMEILRAAYAEMAA